MSASIIDRVKGQQDKDEMLHRALERLIQLYTDKSHFIYEMLQNAEDAEATSISFVAKDECLEVYHDGKPFTESNLIGLCDIGKSDKVDKLNQIGEFGVGFKSVFSICDTVQLYCDPSHYSKNDEDFQELAVEITGFTNPHELKPIQMPFGYTTKFVFPYCVGKSFSGYTDVDVLKNKIAERLKDLGITTLLFMKHLTSIKYDICFGGMLVSGTYTLDKNDISDRCSLVKALGEASQKKDEQISYLKFTQIIDADSNRSVDIAFPIIIDANGEYQCQKAKSPYISVYFPTGTESKLDFVVQGPFRTTPNRSEVPSDNAENIKLARLVAKLVCNSLRELKKTGQLNLSFIKSLPINENSFENFGLFKPVYESIKHMLSKEKLLPCKNGGYVSACKAKILRNDKVGKLFSDDLLTELINDGNAYCWLPTVLTETNKEYKSLFEYLTGELGVEVIRPENLRVFFASNPEFLKNMDDEWFIGLYNMYDSVPAAFSKDRYTNNTLTAEIIKTSKGTIVAPYKKTESRNYIPNVFLPSKQVRSLNVNFILMKIFKRCRHFFEDILQLQEPDEFEFFVKDFESTYSEKYNFNEEAHLGDIKTLLKYLNHPDHSEQILQIAKKHLLLRCKKENGFDFNNPYKHVIYTPTTETGIDVESYFVGLNVNAAFVDLDFYESNGINISDLAKLNVRCDLLIGKWQTRGEYNNGKKGKNPEWYTLGDYRWNLSIDNLTNALKYISANLTKKSSIKKSAAILKTLYENEHRLVGDVYIGGNTPSLYNEPCQMLSILLSQSIYGWNGKWIYSTDGEWVSPKSISKRELNSDIYGKINIDSKMFDYLNFKKTKQEIAEEGYDKIPPEVRESYFAIELQRRFGLTPDELKGRVSGGDSPLLPAFDDSPLQFPTYRVKNWESLRKHVIEIFSCANPVEYIAKVRIVRPSRPEKEIRTYLANQYRYDEMHKYACQMCHNTISTYEASQLFNKPELELEPMHLCLCNNCAEQYRNYRRSEQKMEALKKSIENMSKEEISSFDYVSVDIEDKSIWFTAMHFAEIKELLSLLNDIQCAAPVVTPSINKPDMDNEIDSQVIENPISSQFIGKKVRDNIRRFVGTIVACSTTIIELRIDEGDGAGTIIKYDFEQSLKSKFFEFL